MQQYQPNTLISDRFLLKEQLSYDAGSGQQVWTVTDTQTGQALIARFHADGSTEWFNDNRPPVPPVVPPPPAAAQTPVVAPPPVAAVPPRPAPGSPFAPVPKKRRYGWLLFLLLLAALGAAGYFNQQWVMDTYKSWSGSEPDSTLAGAATVENSGLFGADKDGYPSWEPESMPEGNGAAPAIAETPLNPGPVWETPGADRVGSARQSFAALVLMDADASLSSYQHAFEEAIAGFGKLRESGRHRALCDSVYIIATDRGDQHYRSYQRNPVAETKAKALVWYRTAAAANASAYSKKRIAELQSRAPKNEPSDVSNYFPKDPELNF